MSRLSFITICACVVAGVCLAAVLLKAFSGSGSLERITTLSGVYSVCRPDGYPGVCFANKSGDGGFSCIPYVGECR